VTIQSSTNITMSIDIHIATTAPVARVATNENTTRARSKSAPA
jgi:hypothetical protein